MPKIIVTYETDPPATLNNTTAISIQAAGGVYKHENKAVKQLDIDLDTAASATLTVTSSATTMPGQTCFTSYGTGQPGPFRTEWRMTNTTTGTMTLTIPAASTASYFARMAILGGSDIEINVLR